MRTFASQAKRMFYANRGRGKGKEPRVVHDQSHNNYSKLPELFHVRKHGVTLDVVTTINNGREVQALSPGRQLFVLKNGVFKEVK